MFKLVFRKKGTVVRWVRVLDLSYEAGAQE